MRATVYWRYVLSPIVVVCAVCCTLLLFLCPDAAQADDLPGWYRSYYQYDYDVGAVSSNSSNLTKSDWWDPQLIDSTYMGKILNSEPKPAPKGMPLGEAVRNGFTTFTDGAGNVQQIADVQKDLAQAVLDGDDYQHWAVTVAEGKSSTDRQREMARFRKANTRVGATSSQIKKAQKATKAVNAKVISTVTVNKSDQKVSQALFSKLTEKFGQKTGGKIAAAASGNMLKAAGAKILTVANGATDLLAAEQLAVFDANGIVGLLGIDQSTECEVITNGVARFLLGISETCSNFEAGKKLIQQQNFKIGGFCYKYYPGSTYPVYCIDGSMSVTVSANGDAETLFNPSAANTSTLDVAFATSKKNLVRFASLPFSIQCSNNLSLNFSHCNALPYVRAITRPYDLYLADSWNPYVKVDENQSKRKVKTTVHGSDGNDYSAESEGTAGDAIACSGFPILPQGVTPQSVTLTSTAPDGTEQTILDHVQIQDDVPSGSTGTKNGYIDLIDTRINKSCYDSAYACAAWPQEVQKATGNTVTLDNNNTTKTKSDMPYKCVWQSDDGTSTEIAIGECTVLSNSFTESNQYQGTTGSDPSTGEQINDPVDDPKPSDKVDYAQCVATDVSWNPVSWVFVPVKCALQWAFYPSQDNTETQMLKVQQKAGNSGIDQLPKAFNSSFGALQNSFGQHCQGPEMHLNVFGHDLIPSSHPFSVCDGTGLEKLPTFSRAAFIVLSCAVCYITIRKWLSAMFGFGIGNSETAGEK